MSITKDQKTTFYLLSHTGFLLAFSAMLTSKANVTETNIVIRTAIFHISKSIAWLSINKFILTCHVATLLTLILNQLKLPAVQSRKENNTINPSQ